jgi:hypothetical protein
MVFIASSLSKKEMERRRIGNTHLQPSENSQDANKHSSCALELLAQAICGGARRLCGRRARTRMRSACSGAGSLRRAGAAARGSGFVVVVLLAEGRQSRCGHDFPCARSVCWAGNRRVCRIIVRGLDARGVQGCPDSREIGEVWFNGYGFTCFFLCQRVVGLWA